MKIKIFTSYHKPCELFQSGIITPVQVGASINGAYDAQHAHDSDGENISAKNRTYCELTAQYWAWKNVQADYYGFMHYRRYFSFNPQRLPEDSFGNVTFRRLDDDAAEKLCLNDAQIEAMVQGYDVLSVAPQDVREMDGSKSVYEHYKKSPYHRISDLDTVCDVISRKYPDYKQAAERYLNGTTGYFCNMYILSQKIFNEYCAWMFDILAEHERLTDLSDYDINEYRVSGFLSERLWGIFYTKLKEDKQLKCRELQKSFFANTEKGVDILPAFAENNVPIVIAADDKYVPYVTVMLRSLIETADPARNYDVIALNSSITKKHQAQIKAEFCANTNLSIRFCDVSPMYSGLNLKTHFHITVETYYRLLMQEIMKHYDKVLYIDSDLVVLDDVAKLYDTDVEGYCLAGVRDIDMAGNYHGCDPSRKEYFEKVLTIKDPYAYINAGVLVMNLKEFRKQFTAGRILDVTAQEDWLYMDQDILNYLCDGRIKHIDMAWNVVMNWVTPTGSRMQVMKCAPHQIYLDYMESRKQPKIAHYAGFLKPWDVPDCDLGEYFWKYAAMTGVYEQLLQRLRQPETAAPAQSNAGTGDPYMIRINGLDEPLYVDGVYIKLINKLNRMFPKGSKKRERFKRFMRRFSR